MANLRRYMVSMVDKCDIPSKGEFGFHPPKEQLDKLKSEVSASKGKGKGSASKVINGDTIGGRAHECAGSGVDDSTLKKKKLNLDALKTALAESKKVIKKSGSKVKGKPKERGIVFT